MNAGELDAKTAERVQAAFDRAASSSVRLGRRASEVTSHMNAWLAGGNLPRVSEPPARISQLMDSGAVRRVLVAEDDEALGRSLLEFLTSAGLQCTLVPSVRAALTAIRAAATPFNTLLLDLDLGDGYGIEVAEHARADCPNLDLLVMSGKLPARLHEVAERMDTRKVLSKPFAPQELLDLLRKPTDDAPTHH